jgi:1-acyl-sn-glycerol-3-phosphate acyltransferase
MAILVWIVLVTILIGSFIIILCLFGNFENLVHRIARFWGFLIVFVSRIHVTVEGASNIDPSKSYIYMSNHQSNFDIPVLLAYLKVQFRWLAKVELFKIPIFGRAMRNAGYISINRSDRRAAIESLNQAADAIRDGISILIYPEGTRSVDGNIRPFKKGGFVLAADSGIPIVPVIVHGTYAIMSKNSLRIKPGPVVMEICEPVETTGYTKETKDELLEKVRAIICERFERRNEGEQKC